MSSLRTLTAYGHSWVAGQDASGPDLGFVELATRALGMVPDNRGVGGSSTPDTAALVERQPPPASALYVVLTGLNDARQNGDNAIDLYRYGAALARIFAALRRANPVSVVVAVEQPHLVDYSLHAPHDRGSNQIIDAYNARLRAVSGAHPGVALAPILGWDAGTMLAADTVHPNDAGHAAVARAVIEAGGVR